MLIGIAVIIGLAIPSKIYSDRSEALHYQSPLDVLSVNPTATKIKEAISYVAIKYGLNESELYQTIQCESQFNHNQYGDKGLAFGLAQFHKATFMAFCKGDYYSAKDQLTCLAEMWNKGLQRHWSCWKEYFSS